MKRMLSLITLLSISFTAYAGAIQNGVILKNDTTDELAPIYCRTESTGEICEVHQVMAEAYCSKRGMRLPTAREWGKFRYEMGASEIKPFEGFDKDISGLVQAWKKTSDNGSISDFFRQEITGFKAPESDLGKNRFWSSSSGPEYSSALLFVGKIGWISSVDTRTYKAAVLCISDADSK